jgi:hypothetical protein
VAINIGRFLGLLQDMQILPLIIIANDYHHWVEMPNEIYPKVVIPQNIKLSKNSTHFDPVHDLVMCRFRTGL